MEGSIDGNRVKALTLSGVEFVRRYLRHVLPRGLRSIRYYGFCHPAAVRNRERIRMHTGMPIRIGPQLEAGASSSAAPAAGKLHFLLPALRDADAPRWTAAQANPAECPVARSAARHSLSRIKAIAMHRRFRNPTPDDGIEGHCTGCFDSLQNDGERLNCAHFISLARSKTCWLRFTFSPPVESNGPHDRYSRGCPLLPLTQAP